MYLVHLCTYIIPNVSNNVRMSREISNLSQCNIALRKPVNDVFFKLSLLSAITVVEIIDTECLMWCWPDRLVYDKLSRTDSTFCQIVLGIV